MARIENLEENYFIHSFTYHQIENDIENGIWLGGIMKSNNNYYFNTNYLYYWSCFYKRK